MSNTLTLANFLLEAQLLGQGLASPLSTDSNTQDFETINGESNVIQCIEDLINTRIGERLMNEDFGTTVPGALFENKTAFMHAAPAIIINAINKFEPRVTNVTATAVDTDINVVEINVSFVIRATASTVNKVFPFYLQPPAGGIAGS